MYRPSRTVASDQQEPHQGLIPLLDRHLQSPYRRPIAAHTAAVWQTVRIRLEERGVEPGAGVPLLLDSGCGVGESSLRLAQANPQACVLAVDQSADRLSRIAAHARILGLPGLPVNLLAIRADLSDLWRLMLRDGFHPSRHWLLYPNPWPKPMHLGRRWHAHPVFPYLLALGGCLELRTNWRVYADEMALSVARALGQTVQVHAVEFQGSEDILTPFERKYSQSGQQLWRVSLDLPGGWICPTLSWPVG